MLFLYSCYWKGTWADNCIRCTGGFTWKPTSAFVFSL